MVNHTDSENTNLANNVTRKVIDAIDIDKLDLELKPEELRIFVSGESKPFHVKNAVNVTFGRGITVLSGQKQFIDLEQANGALLGVSRQHACIHITTHGFYLEDLKSTNGTHHNENPVPPLSRKLLASGDTITLGQLRLNVYFNTNSPYSIEQINLIETKSHTQDVMVSESGIQSKVIADEIGPILVALTELHKLSLNKPESGPKIISISIIKHNQFGNVLQVELTEIEQTVKLINEYVQPLRMLHQSEILQARKLGDEKWMSTLKIQNMVSSNTAPQNILNVLNFALQKLPPQYQSISNEKLKHILTGILFSRFDIAMSRTNNQNN